MPLTREAMIKGLSADMHKWYWEAADPFYKKHRRVYSQICRMRSLSEIKGSYYQTTSAIGIDKLDERDENGAIAIHRPSEGYTIQIKVRNYGVIIPISYELNRDWWRVPKFLENYIKENGPLAVEETKEDARASLFNYGGYTAGHAIYNNSTPNQSDASGDGCYDGTSASIVPFFSRSTGAHVSKGGTTYFNAYGNALTDFDNLVTSHNLLVDTNAKRENDTTFDNSQNKILVVPPALEVTARQWIKSTSLPGSNNNDINPLYNMYDLVVDPWLSEATSWAIGRRGFGIEFFDADPHFKFWEDNDTGQLKARILVDFALGVTNWRGWVGSNFPLS